MGLVEHNFQRGIFMTEPSNNTNTFAFIIHPIQIKKDVARKFPLLGRVLPEPVINFASRYFPPLYISEITGVKSQATGHEILGWFLAVPYTPPTMMRLPVEEVYRKIVATGEKAEALGAKTLGLGAYNSVVGDAGKTIAERLDIAVTTGDSYTVAIAIQALEEAAHNMEIDMSQARVAVVGATGAIGKACAQMLASRCEELIVLGRRADATEAIRESCEGKGASVIASTTMKDIYDCDLVLTVTSAIDAVIEPEHLKPGAIVLDVARPRDVSVRVAQERDDVLVIEGGMVEVPGANADFHFNFGFPPRKVFACMAETMALAMEGIYEDYTIGRDLELWRIEQIDEIATRHGFRLAGLRSFEHAVTPEKISMVLDKALVNRKKWSPSVS
jgi:fatty aldehyde-generating acyl-ACP reductase